MPTDSKFSRRFVLLCVLSILSIRCSTPAAAQTWTGLKVSGQNIVDASGNNFVPHGFGVGEWTNTEAYMLEWPDGNGKYLWYYGYTRINGTLDTLMGEPAADQYRRAWKENVIAESDVAKWQSWGVNTVRLSINYHWLSPSDGVYLDSGWRWIDQVIAWSKAHRIYVILCMHAAPGAQNPELMSDTVDGQPHLWTQPDIYQPWAIHLWQAIAQRYASEPTVAGYDLLDEPLLSESNPANGGPVVRAFYVKATRAIREVDTNHIIFACGTEWCGSPAGVKAMLPKWDNNMVLVFHKYWDKNDVPSIRGYLNIRSKYNVPLWNGETGENSNAWAKGMVNLLGKYNIGWSWWTYKKLNQNSNPCSIPEPSNYSEILDYINGKGPQPPQADADTIMLTLANNSATSNCTWNDGLVQALFGVTNH
jgi:aryl-phospho-beta-D-glucosidase BglC (GH1 family)